MTNILSPVQERFKIALILNNLLEPGVKSFLLLCYYWKLLLKRYSMHPKYAGKILSNGGPFM